MKNLLFIGAALVFILSGCGAKDQANEHRTNLGLNRPSEDYSKTMNVRDVRNSTEHVGESHYRKNDLHFSENLANRVAGLKEVRSATVFVNNHYAYVAAMLNNDEDDHMTTALEEKIADTVRGADPTVKKVYVSTNPDFIERMDDYAHDVRNGKPISGFGEEFNEMVQRIFPNPE